MSTDSNPLIFGYAVDSKGAVEKLNWDSLKSGPLETSSRRIWLHLDRRHAEAKAWLMEKSGFDDFEVDALIREETRPRAVEHEDGWLINLRGINFNEGEQDDFMIALRVWVTENVLITTRAMKIRAAEDLSLKYEDGHPPVTHGDAISYIAERLVTRMEPVIEQLGDRVDEIDESLTGERPTIRKSELVVTRRHAISMRRFMSPQKEALFALCEADHGLFSPGNRKRFRDTLNILQRISEDLESVRDRAQMVQEQITEVRAEAMNQRLFVLSILSAVFLPLGFLTGLFGVNVAGMPGTDFPFAFLILCLGLFGLGIGTFWLFRKLGWMS